MLHGDSITLHGGSRKEQSDTVKRDKTVRKDSTEYKNIKIEKTDIVEGVVSPHRILEVHIDLSYCSDHLPEVSVSTYKKQA